MTRLDRKVDSALPSLFRPPGRNPKFKWPLGEHLAIADTITTPNQLQPRATRTTR